MTSPHKVQIKKIPTGVPGLDEILGGGIPEYSFNIIAGSPGCGKTTLAHQIVFANATAERPALYFTVLGEPALKMLRYQQQYSFFDVSKLAGCVRFINLSIVLAEEGLPGVIAAITKAVEASKPGIVVVDSFRSLLWNAKEREGDLQSSLQDLALALTTWETTALLIGEFAESELRANPVFTVADGLLWLYQNVERNSVVRKLQIVKLRGQASVPGLHTFRITNGGLQAFSRTFGMVGRRSQNADGKRLSMGNADLDAMMGGGVPEGDSLLISGSSGTGKSLLATEFIAAGLRAGEPGIVAVFEERPDEYVARANSFGLKLEEAYHDGRLIVIYLRPLDLSVDETLQEIVDAIKRTNAKRLVLDSLAGFEMALAPGFRADFRESLYRMIMSLTGIGVTIVSTLEMIESFVELPFSSYSISFLTDDIIRLRYVEIDAQLRKIIMIVKMRGGAHSIDICEYEIAGTGLVIGKRVTGYGRLTTGIPDDLRLPPASEESGEPRIDRGAEPPDAIP